MYELALCLSVLVFGFVVAYYMRSPAFSAFHPLLYYCAFHGLLFVVRPVFGYILDYQALYNLYGFTPSVQDKTTVILAATVGFLSFAFFSLRAGGVPMQFKQDAFIEEERRRLGAILPFVLMICLPLGLYSLSHSFSLTLSDSKGGMVLDRATGAMINTTGNGYLNDAQLMLASCGAFVAWIYRFRLLALLPLVVFVVFRAGSGGRGPFVTALTSVLLLYLYEKRLKYPGLRFAMAGTLMLAAFVSVGNDRGKSIREALGFEQQSEFVETGSDEKFLERMDFANMEFFEYIVYAVPQRTGTYDYFLSNLQLFTEPVPRVLWSGKPVGAPIQLFSLWNYGDPIGMTFSLPGAGWLEMGWLGVIIWCGLWGHFLGRVYTAYVNGPQHSLHTIGYMIFLPILIIAYRDGVLITIAKQALFFFLPVVIWHLLARYVAMPTVPEMRAFVAARLVVDTGRGSSGKAPASERKETPAAHDLLPAAARRRHEALARLHSVSSAP